MAETRHSRFLWIVQTILIAAALCPLAMGKTIRVANNGAPDHATIQAAIDAAGNGDTVLVAPGTYAGDGNRDIDFKGKAITVRSEAGPTTCIIRCDGSGDVPHRGFLFSSHEDASSVLDGFTITGAYARNEGGGILCDGGSPAIRNCVIRGNTALCGGGVSLASSNALVQYCVISGNRVHSDGDGGGLSLEASNALVSNCIVSGNHGGGINCRGSDVRKTTTSILNCTIQSNRGGGLFCGGGSQESVVRVINCIVVNNWAGGEGNQIIAASENLAAISGLRTEIVQSCIQSASCTDIWRDGCDGIAYTSPKLMLDQILYLADPLFANPGYWDSNGTPDPTFDDFWVDGDYHLKSQAGRWDLSSNTWVKDVVTSPCIDAGDPNSPVGGEPTPNGGRINMGAYGGTAEASKSLSSLSGKYGGGSGAAVNPYLIFTAEQFDAVGAEPNDWDKHFKLMADIDLGGYTGQQLHLIGVDADNPFSGVFDGNGHKVSGLGRRNSPGFTTAALFGYLTGTVKGVGLIDPNVGGRLLYYTGSLVGDNHGLIADCYAEDVNVVGGGWNAGGLVGRNMGTLSNCRATGMVRDRCTGGLVGKNGGTITGCSSSATVAGTSPVGGLVGSGVGGTISNSCSTGTATGDDRTGGLVGHNYGGAITRCYSAAVVVGNDGVGGLVGENWQGLITDCYSAANVTGDRLTAGLVGDSGGGAITNCYAVGPVVGRWPAGGIVSWRHDDDVVTGCLWDMDTTGCPWSAAGVGKTTAEMQTAATFLAAGWDFVGETTNGMEDFWQIPERTGYPKLSWETGAK